MGPRIGERVTATTTIAGSFSEWRTAVAAAGTRPIILVAGSRGKTTVIRLLDALFRAAGLRTAVWTDLGVEIEGVRQRGELIPWSRVGTALDTGRLDVAIQELDWLTIPTHGLQPEAYPLVVVTNVCANREACLIHDEARLAIQLLPQVLASAHRNGLVVLNGEDFAVAGDEVPRERPEILTALSKDTPLVRNRLAAGDVAAWVEDGALMLGDASAPVAICKAVDLHFALEGAAGFQVHNALSAATAAIACGLPASLVGTALRSYRLSPLRAPGSFNRIEVRGITVVVGRPEPSWFLRPVIRSLRDRNRLITVVGRLNDVPESDVTEVGRLIGRASAAVVLHSEQLNQRRASALRGGIALNEIPPPIVHTTTERRALNRAIEFARPGDAMLVLADRPVPILRALLREVDASRQPPELAAD